jgi:hypothetical protein
MGAETQRKRFAPSTEVERVVSHVRPAIESTPLRLEPFVSPRGTTAAVIPILYAAALPAFTEYSRRCDILTAPGPSELTKGATVNGSAEYKELRKLVGPWGLEPQTSTVSI